jgi:hypothetical protein
MKRAGKNIIHDEMYSMKYPGCNVQDEHQGCNVQDGTSRMTHPGRNILDETSR